MMANEVTAVSDKLQKLSGVVPPLILPLTEGGAIDFQGLERQVEFLLSSGVHGLWVNGSTGEFFALSPEERAEVVRFCVEQVGGRVPVIAQVGDTSTRRVLAHAGAALEAGADGLSVILPYYAIYAQEELKSHYREISRAVGRPIFLYQLPQMCKVALSVPNILELAKERILAGIKDSAGDVDFYYRLVRGVKNTGSSLRCFYGSSSLVDVGLYVGGHGVMCAIANLVPDLCCQAYAAAVRGDWDAARTANERILLLIDALTLRERTTWAPLIAAYKFVLRELGLICSDRVFEPLKPLTQEEKEGLRRKALPLLSSSLK